MSIRSHDQHRRYYIRHSFVACSCKACRGDRRALPFRGLISLTLVRLCSFSSRHLIDGVFRRRNIRRAARYRERAWPVPDIEAASSRQRRRPPWEGGRCDPANIARLSTIVAPALPCEQAGEARASGPHAKMIKRPPASIEYNASTAPASPAPAIAEHSS